MYADQCPTCGARRTDHQVGLEQTPDEYVARLVEVFREVRRVLRDDGTLWLNLGDSFGDGGQLLGTPWRVAFAMQRDGWVLRMDVVWAKPNPMPESVTNRPTKAHEMLFLFAKGQRRMGQFAHASDEDARWLALLFDTEGNIVIKRAEREGRRQYGAQMAFANTSRDLLERARDIIGKGSIHERLGTNAPVFYWQLGGREARDLLHRIYPFLIVKQRQARVAIHMQDVVALPKRRPGGYRTVEHAAFLERCWETVKALNQFGDPDLSWVPEPLFLLAKSPRYFYDADAVREGIEDPSRAGKSERVNYADGSKLGRAEVDPHIVIRHANRNKRSVWTVATQPFPGAHFAVFPPKLIEPCVLSGSSPRACGVCGGPWQRIIEATGPDGRTARMKGRFAETEGGVPLMGDNAMDRGNRGSWNSGGQTLQRTTTGWEPSCSHNDDTGTSTVLDPFAGSGTTGLVALQHGRSFLGIELNPAYVEMATERISMAERLGFRPPEKGPEPMEGQLSMDGEAA